MIYGSPKDAEMKRCGWTETHGIALWTNPSFPNIMLDTNSEVIGAFHLPDEKEFGWDEQNEFLRTSGLQLEEV